MCKKIVWVTVIFVTAMLLSTVAFAAQKADKDAILEEISGFLDENPEIIRGIVFTMSDQYMRDQKTDEAIALYEKAMKILPDSEDFLSRLADLYNQKADLEKVIEIYEAMTELKPDNVWYFQRLSEAYMRAEDKESATAVWEGLMEGSDNAEVFMQAANFYNSQNDMDNAISAVKKAAELNPENIGYLQNLESFYVRAERFDEAEAVCKDFLANAKDQWQRDWANSELISIYQRQDKLADLVTAFEKELAKAPDDVNQYRKLADLYQRWDKRDTAIEVYEKAVAAGVKDRDMDYRLLDLYEGVSQFDKAVTQLKKIIAANPTDNYLYERLGNLLGRADKREDAKKAWKTFLSKVPNDAGALSRFGDRLNEWGEVNEAIDQYRKAQTLDVNNMWYTMRIADILIGKNRAKEAKKELTMIITTATDTWIKQEAERKLTDITAAAQNAATTVPEKIDVPVARPAVAEPVEVEPVSAPEDKEAAVPSETQIVPSAEPAASPEAAAQPKETTEKKKKRKRGFFW